MAENENPAALVKPESKPAKATKPKKEMDGIQLPILVEFIVAFSVILLILVFLAMTAISWLTNATLLDFALRTSVTLLVLGSLLMLISRQVSTGMLSASPVEQETVQKQASPAQSETSESPENTETHSTSETQ